MADKDKRRTYSGKRQFENHICMDYLSIQIITYALPQSNPILLVAFFGSFSSPADAQVNLKTGYNFSILSNTGLDDIISTYNDIQDYTSPFKKLTWLHGFEVGLRMKSEGNALELTYQGAYRTLRAQGQAADLTYTDKMNFSVHSIALGYQATSGIFGLGADFQYQFYKTKVTSEQDGNAFRNGQKMTAIKPYLMLTLRGGKGVDMAIQPYYVHPFKKYELQPFNDFVGSGIAHPAAERWNRFGVTVLFYNGSK